MVASTQHPIAYFFCSMPQSDIESADIPEKVDIIVR